MITFLFLASFAVALLAWDFPLCFFGMTHAYTGGSAALPYAAMLLFIGS
jgi:hypothetical protein